MPGSLSALQAGATVTTTKNDALLVDIDSDGEADPGDTLRYTVVVTNTGGVDALGLTVTDTLDLYTSLVTDSLRVTPLARDDAYDAIGNTRIIITATNGLLANDVDPDDPAPNPAFNDNLTVTGFDVTSANGGVVNVDDDGSFTYDPPLNFEGADTFTYTVEDAHGQSAEATVTITVSEMVWYVDNSASPDGDGRSHSPFDSLGNSVGGADDIIFIAAGGGNYATTLTLQNGQQLVGQDFGPDDFATVTGLPATPGAAFPTSGASPTLTSSGDAITLANNNSVRGLTVGNTSGAGLVGTNFGSLAVRDVTINGAGAILDLDSGAVDASFDALTTTGSVTFGVSLTGLSGSLSAGSGSIAGVSGVPFDVNGGTATVTYPGNMSKNSSGRLVQVLNRPGAAGNITFSGNLTCNSACTGINVTSNTGGTILFSGSSKVLNTGGNAAVTLNSNGGATITFGNGGLDVDTTNGAGFNATDGGTVNVTGSGNTIDTTTGIAVTIDNTTIGGGGVLFERVSANGAPAGILLNGTGSAGTFEVTGDGASDPSDATQGRTTVGQSGSLTLGSGGTIVNTTDGVRLTNAANVVLRNMVIGEVSATRNDAVSGVSVIADNGIELNNTTAVTLDNVLISQTADQGIEGANLVNGLTLQHSEILNAGDTGGGGPTDGDDAMDFITFGATLVGNVDISNSVIAGMSDTGLEVENFSGALALTVDNSFIGNNHHSDSSCDPCEGDGFLLRADGGSAEIHMTVADTTFNNVANDGIDMGNDQGSNVSTLTLSSVFGTNNSQADNLVDTANTNGTLTVDITDITSDASHRGTVLFFKADGAATTDITIDTSGASPNVISGSAIGNGIDVFIDGDPGTGPLVDGNARLSVRNTSISNIFSAGVNMIVQDMATAAGTLDVTLDGVSTSQPTRTDNVIVGSVEAIAGGGGNGTLQLNMVNSSIGIGSVFSGTALEGLVLRGDRQIDVACNDDGNDGNGEPCTNIGSLTSDDTLIAAIMNENGNQVNDGGLRPFAGSDVFTSATLRNNSGEVLIIAPGDVGTPLAAAAGSINFAGGAQNVDRNAAAHPDRLYSPSLLEPITEDSLETGPQSQLTASSLPAHLSELPPAATPGDTLNLLGDPFTLAAGETITLTFDVEIAGAPPPGVTSVQNQASVSGDNFTTVLSADPDPDPSFPPTNGETITPLDLEADVAIVKTDDPDPATAGQPLTYTITISNAGPNAASDLTVTDNLPAEFNYISDSCGGALAGGPPGGTWTWTAAGIEVGGSLPCVITGTVLAGFSGTMTNTASVTALTPDPAPANNTIMETTTVTDNVFSIDDVAQAEGDSGVTTFSFTVARSNNATAASVDVATSDVTGLAGEDYTALPPTTVNFTAGGGLTQTVNVEVHGDAIVELDETFVVSLSNPVNGAIGDGEGQGTIENDDSAALSIDDVSQAEGDSGTTVFTFTVTLSAAVDSALSVDFATADGTATAPGDYVANSGTLNFDGAAGETRTIAVSVNGDTIEEDDETFTVELNNLATSGRDVSLVDTQGQGIILDDDGEGDMHIYWFPISANTYESIP